MIIHYVENNNNIDFYRNGENQFLKNLFHKYKGKQLNVFDLGSNKGDYTHILIQLAQKFDVDANIHLFEPMPQTFEKLQKRFSEKKALVLNNFGVSNKNGENEIYYNQSQSPHASLYNRQAVKLENKAIIKLIRLEDYINEHKITKIHLIKLDVEGHEFSALKGLGKYLSGNFVDFIQFEYGGTYIDSRIYLFDMFELLQSSGFNIYKIKRNSLQTVSYSPVLENFAYSNYVAISKFVI